jgi:murein DD-endopeptidase MepM/ murein hydrolase activator NlpD
VAGDLRENRIGPPVSNGNAPCGVVDLLDFPLAPPDGANASGGGDFGVFRGRYDKYHAGEDWWGVRGRQSFGEPVYSIGHGLVTYAEPEGWNRDKGVIIIQHTFTDGSSILSFYGHLDPPSVLLRPGICVARGQQIGQIGRPRSSPHLHFEIRSQAPYQTLTGYWPEDPTLVGWLPPSAFIWNQRNTSAPGVLWTLPDNQPYTLNDVQGVGQTDEETFLTIQSAQLVGIGLADGREHWRWDGEMDVAQAMIDPRFPIVYAAGRNGRIEALSLLRNGNETTAAPTLQPLWELDLDLFGTPHLLPLTGGGLVYVVREQFFAISAEGTLLWQNDSMGELVSWTTAGEQLVVSTSGADGLFGTVDETGIQAWITTGEDWPVIGSPITAGSRLWHYNRDGLYRLDLETQTPDFHYPLPRGLPSLGDAVGLPDGGLLLAHADTAGRRLLAFDANGRLRWERSYEGIILGRVHLVALNGRVYLIAEDNGSSSRTITVYAVDLNNAALTLLFAGGSRSGNSADTWVMTAGNYLLLNIAGSNLLSLDNTR